MENKEYLSEERYQRTNAKVKKVGKILLIIGIIILAISFVLLIIGFIGTGNSVVSGFSSFGDDDVIGVQNTASGVFGNFGLFALGSFMVTIGFGLTIAGGVVMLIAHRREITAYTTQQVMPVAQEGIEKISPTIGKAAGEIAKGIKQGLDEANKE